MKNKSLSPKYKAMTFDYYQVGQQQLQKMKSEKLIIQQRSKPILNLQLIMKGQSQHEKSQPQSARANTLQDLLFRHQHRIQSNGIKQKQYLQIDELEKIKMKFLRISSKWKAKEDYYIKQLLIANQEITRLNQIISTLSKSE